MFKIKTFNIANPERHHNKAKDSAIPIEKCKLKYYQYNNISVGFFKIAANCTNNIVYSTPQFKNINNDNNGSHSAYNTVQE